MLFLEDALFNHLAFFLQRIVASVLTQVATHATQIAQIAQTVNIGVLLHGLGFQLETAIRSGELVLLTHLSHLFVFHGYCRLLDILLCIHDERVLKGFFCRHSSRRIFLQQQFQQVCGTHVYFLDVLEIEFAVAIQLDYFFLILALEQFAAGKKNVEDAAEREEVTLGVIELAVVFVLQDLGGDIARGAAAVEYLGVRELIGSQAEISDDHVGDVALFP